MKRLLSIKAPSRRPRPPCSGTGSGDGARGKRGIAGKGPGDSIGDPNSGYFRNETSMPEKSCSTPIESRI